MNEAVQILLCNTEDSPHQLKEMILNVIISKSKAVWATPLELSITNYQNLRLEKSELTKIED